jgi:hypothetical protein
MTPVRVPDRRHRLLTILTIGAMLETAWVVYLAIRLPPRYVAEHWDVAWVGLDAAQVVLFLATAWAAWRRRIVVIIFAVMAATLLAVDAWFDLTTARRGDVQQSALLLIIEVPAALWLYWLSVRTFREVIRHYEGPLLRQELDGRAN